MVKYRVKATHTHTDTVQSHKLSTFLCSLVLSPLSQALSGFSSHSDMSTFISEEGTKEDEHIKNKRESDARYNSKVKYVHSHLQVSTSTLMNREAYHAFASSRNTQEPQSELISTDKTVPLQVYTFVGGAQKFKKRKKLHLNSDDKDVDTPAPTNSLVPLLLPRVDRPEPSSSNTDHESGHGATSPRPTIVDSTPS